MSSSACLVVSPPEYTEPEQTAPLLLGTEAFPDLRQILRVDMLVQDQVEFGAAVLSEDTGAPVLLHFYTDYGQMTGNNNDPWLADDGTPELEPGYLSQGPRTFRGRYWTPPGQGCHSVTLMASHDFDFRPCPRDQGDYSYLVWQVIVCEGPECPDVCPPVQCDADQCPSCFTIDATDGGAP